MIRRLVLLFVFFASSQVYCKTKLFGVSWDNCGSVTDPIQLLSLQISPDSIRVPGEITLSAEAHLNFNVTSPIMAELELKRKTVFGWLPLPCVDDIGSCKYDDICSLSPYAQQCPQFFQEHGLPCHCPLIQGTYKVDNVAVEVKGNIPHWLEKGHYKGQVKLSENGDHLACYDFETRLN